MQTLRWMAGRIAMTSLWWCGTRWDPMGAPSCPCCSLLAAGALRMCRKIASAMSPATVELPWEGLRRCLHHHWTMMHWSMKFSVFSIVGSNSAEKYGSHLVEIYGSNQHGMADAYLRNIQQEWGTLMFFMNKDVTLFGCGDGTNGARQWPNALHLMVF